MSKPHMMTKVRNRQCSSCGKRFTVKLNRHRHIDPNKYWFSKVKLPNSDKTVIIGKTKDGYDVYDCPDGWKEVEMWECTQCLVYGAPSHQPSKEQLAARAKWIAEGSPKFKIAVSPQVAGFVDERW